MVETLYKKIGYTFNNKSLLTQALTHRSASMAHNERLEFIGDGVVNLVIGEELYHTHPFQPEGELSRWRAALVQRETLYEVGLEWGLDKLLILGPGEKKSGGQYRSSNLSNAVEAVIGAVYLDANFETVKKLILQTFKDRLSLAHINSITKDPKTQLQEWLQANKIPLPSYLLLQTSGEDHDCTFHIQCTIKELNASSTGQGSSKKRAEQDAAQQMLAQLIDKKEF